MPTKKANEKQILIVDDVPKNIQIVGSILSKEKLRIAFATDGETALQLAFTNDFDLVLLDVMMPGMDGFEVCKRLRENEKTFDLPIIFLTAKSDIDSMLAGFELGAQDYVSKPFNASELIARVRTHLELREKKIELSLLNQRLEEKVKERTFELEKANLKLSRLEKAKSEFLSIIGHELRSPLTGIIGLTNLLNQTTVDDEQKKYLEFLEKTSQKLSRFSDTAMLITMLQADAHKLEYFSTSANTFFTTAIKQLQHTIDDKEIQLSIDLESQRFQIFADPELIKKSISLLLESCIYNLPKKGKLNLSAYTVNNQKVIEINDSGEGFEKEVIAQLSEHISQEITIVNQDVGLSIAAVRLIMMAHNGSLQIGNNDEGGAKIRLIFEPND